MDMKQETLKYFNNDFSKNLPPTFPEKTQKITEKLNELTAFWYKEYYIQCVCDEMQACLQLLEVIKKRHQFSVNMPADIFQVPKEIDRLDSHNDLLLNNVILEAVNKTDKSIHRLKECVSALEKEAEKKKDEEEIEAKNKSIGEAYSKSLDDVLKD